VGLVARAIEAAGIPTVLVSTGRDLTELVCPPRSLFVNFPMGNPFGPPDQPDVQRGILQAALELAAAEIEPGTIVDLRDEWPTDFTDKVSASLVAMTPDQVQAQANPA
jgi:D-proline reductase (dithiol) PrdB